MVRTVNGWMRQSLDDFCEGSGLQVLGGRVAHNVGRRVRFAENEVGKQRLWRRRHTKGVFDVVVGRNSSITVTSASFSFLRRRRRCL